MATNILVNPGSVTPIALDLVGTVNYQVVKLDMGTAGTTSLFGGTSNPLPVVLSSGIAGEDLINNILVTEDRYTYATSFGTATTTIKTGSGYLKRISVTNPMMFGAAGTISVWDNTAASGTPMGTITIPAGTTAVPFPVPFDESFSNGLTLSFGGTSLPYLNISYR